MKRFTLLFGLVLLVLLASSATAGVPKLINFQGVLKTPAGTVVSDDSYSVTFTIYAVPAGGTALWTETQSVTTVGGLFAVLLGSSNPVPDTAFKGSERWLGIAVSPDGEMLQRQQLVSVGYAYRVNSVDSASGGTIGGDLAVAAGNLNLDASSATAGSIFKGGLLFIHNFGLDNTFIGRDAGNLTMSGFRNTASGAFALQSNTTSFENTASGALALQNNTIGSANTASGAGALRNNTTGSSNTASGVVALINNTTGSSNTACGVVALINNTTGSNNTAIGAGANVTADNLTNATAIGAGAVVNASNKIRLGNAGVTVIEGQVAYTFPSDRNQKENFRPVDGNEVLRKIREFNLASWNYKGHDPKQFRHYGPMAQDFFAVFGEDGVGKIGTETTINSGDMAGILMVAVQALEKRTAEVAEIKTRLQGLEELMQKLLAKEENATQTYTLNKGPK